MKFSRDLVEPLIWTKVGDSANGLEVVSTKELHSEHRWYDVYTIVFKENDHYYRMFYNDPASELQEDIDFFDDEEELECPEVWPHEKTITIYTKDEL